MVKLRGENLTYTYSVGTPFEKTAIDNISFEVENGEFLGLIGHTGSGKSTLVSHLNGLSRPTSGRLYLDGEDIWAKPKEISKIRFKVGLVFQYPEYQLFEETVYKDIAFGPTNMGLSEAQIDENVRNSAHIVGITDDILEKSPFELSGGQKRRVAIAGVLAMRPEVLVLDEPTAGLDPKGRDEILSKVRDYHKKSNATVVLVSHSMEDIAKNASRVIVMNKAKITMQGTVAQVYQRASELEEIGLTVPQITKLFEKLRERGLQVADGVYTVEAAKAELLRLWNDLGGAKNA